VVEHEETGAVTAAAGWATHASSAANADSLAALADVDPAALGGPALVDAIVASEKALSLLAGTQMRLLAALAEPFVAGDPMRLAARLARKNCAIRDGDSDQMVQLLIPDAAISLASAEVAAALRISPVTAGIRVREAGTMTTVLAPTLNALEAGILDRGKARVIAEHCEPLSPDNKTAVQGLVLPLAGAATTSELRDITGQAVITVDPDGCDERHRAAAARRELAMKALPDAMATLKAFLPADAAVKIFQLADLLATATAGAHGDDRGIGARRIDALVDVADQLLTLGHLDLSYYLGNPLPDHGTPAFQVPADDDRVGSSDSDPHSTNVDPPHPADIEGDNKTTDDATPEPSADVARNDHKADEAAPERSTDLGRTDNDAVAQTSPEQFRNGSTTRPKSTFGCPASSPEVPAGDSRTVAEPGTDSSRIRSARGKRNASPANPAALSGTGKPCAACGSSGRNERSFTKQGRRPHLSVTLGLGTLAGLDDLPGKLAGFGAIPPGLARSIAKSAATITSLLCDPESGSITDVGALVYRPRQALRDQIAALLGTCQFPSCRQPVWRCDIDHRQPFDHQNPEQGGHTTKENTDPYCRRHHLFKHHTEWQTRPDLNSSTVIWISPTGHRYAKGRNLATPPDIWVTTAATDLAERLDTMKATVDVTNETECGGNVPEEILTTMLLRHELNRPPYEYDPRVNDNAIGDSAINDSAINDDVVNQGDAAFGENAGPNDSAPNAQSWPTIEDPPPF
jgi:hypothetical protein